MKQLMQARQMEATSASTNTDARTTESEKNTDVGLPWRLDQTERPELQGDGKRWQVIYSYTRICGKSFKSPSTHSITKIARLNVDSEVNSVHAVRVGDMQGGPKKVSHKVVSISLPNTDHHYLVNIWTRVWSLIFGPSGMTVSSS